jgi:Transposase DDE domain
MSKQSKSKYKTTNWKEYNASLTSRGSLLIWLDRDMKWKGSASGKRGRNQQYSDAAIQFCLTIKVLFNLALRQAIGMVQSLLKLAGLS